MAFQKKEECPKIPAWLTSFSDLMSLLLTFFILLYSMSSLDVAQLEQYLSYFQGEKAKFSKKTSILEPIQPFPKDVALKVKKRIKSVLPPWSYQIVVTAEFVKLRLFDKILFEENSFYLTPKAVKTVRGISEVLSNLKGNYSIRIEGHVSPSTEVKPTQIVKDKWELSVRRATEVLKEMVKNGIDPHKLSAIGYGDSRPLYTWKQPILMQRNNRVEVYIFLGKLKSTNPE